MPCLDTNFLIDLARFRIDIDEVKNLVGSCKFCTIDSVIKELKRIASKRTEVAGDAMVALKLIELNNFEIMKTKERNADDAILSLAEKNFIVATNDIELRRRLKDFKIETIYLRSKKHLAIK